MFVGVKVTDAVKLTVGELVGVCVRVGVFVGVCVRVGQTEINKKDYDEAIALAKGKPGAAAITAK